MARKKTPDRRWPKAHSAILANRRTQLGLAINQADQVLAWCQTAPRFGIWFEVSKQSILRKIRNNPTAGSIQWRLEKDADGKVSLLIGVYDWSV